MIFYHLQVGEGRRLPRPARQLRVPAHGHGDVPGRHRAARPLLLRGGWRHRNEGYNRTAVRTVKATNRTMRLGAPEAVKLLINKFPNF